MPRTLYLPKDTTHGDHSGISITWTPSANRLDFGGWYDQIAGIPGGAMTLAEFFAALGITEKQVKQAFTTAAS